MTTFAKVLAARDRMPTRHVVLTVDSFADDWQDKPLGEIAIGLRKISDSDTQTARAEAAKFAIGMHDDREGQIEAFNDALMRWLIVRGTCDANDVALNAPLFDGSEENVRNALTTKAVRFVWDELERFHLETSPIVHVATNEDFAEFLELAKHLELLDLMSPASQLRIRKLIGFCLTELRDVSTDPEKE